MKKPAPELDQLMWYLAEQGTTQSVEEFEQRYPDLKYELARRMSLVRQLKGEGRKAHRTLEVPVFQPVRVRSVPQSRALVLSVAILSLAAIAAASFTIVSFLQPPPVTMQRKLEPVLNTQRVEQNPPKEPQVEYHRTPGAVEPTHQEPPSIDSTPAYLKPQNLKVEKAPLLSALQLVAQQGGLSLTIAPEMPNPEIKLSYRGMNTIQMLQDLGRQYGFTAFDQGDGTILIIPAVDPNAPKSKTGRTNETEVFERKGEEARPDEP